MRNQRWLVFGTMLLIADVGSIPSAAQIVAIVRRRTICDRSELPSGISGMRIYIASHVVAYKDQVQSIDTQLTPTPGTYKTAAASLVEKHERQKKERAGLDGRARGSQVAGVEAAGTAMGSLGLIAFGGIAWQGISRYPS